MGRGRSNPYTTQTGPYRHVDRIFTDPRLTPSHQSSAIAASQANFGQTAKNLPSKARKSRSVYLSRKANLNREERSRIITRKSNGLRMMFGRRNYSTHEQATSNFTMTTPTMMAPMRKTSLKWTRMTFRLPRQPPPFFLQLLPSMYRLANGSMEETKRWIRKTSIF